MACQRRSGINHEPHWSSPEQGDTPCTHYRRIGEWIAKRSGRIDMGLNAFCRLSRPHHRRTATEDQRYEEASQHCSDYGCARVCRARFGTAYGSGPDCEHRRRAGCYSSRWVRPLFSAQKSERGLCCSARCGPLSSTFGFSPSGYSKSWPFSTKPAVTRPVANSC
jgi:hypothetical protein